MTPATTSRISRRLAKEDGVSLNQWIAAAVAEKVGVVETAAEFLQEARRKRHGSWADEVLEERSQGPSAAGG
ncbi:MAG: pilus assembly protein HicB [Terriglobia bacterium]